MDDYTPTDEQVRSAYVRGMRDTFVAAAADHEAEFDRWLAQHDREALAAIVRNATAHYLREDLPEDGRDETDVIVDSILASGWRPPLPAPSEDERPNARVVTRPFDSDCAIGIRPSGFSHLMWKCYACSCEGAWGAPREKLAELAAEHSCPSHPTPPGGVVTLIEEARRFDTAPAGYASRLQGAHDLIDRLAAALAARPTPPEDAPTELASELDREGDVATGLAGPGDVATSGPILHTSDDTAAVIEALRAHAQSWTVRRGKWNWEMGDLLNRAADLLAARSLPETTADGMFAIIDGAQYVRVDSQGSAKSTQTPLPETEETLGFRVLDASGEPWAWADALAEAEHYLSQVPGGRIEIGRTLWSPVPSADLTEEEGR